jgi:hypothetical protein
MVAAFRYDSKSSVLYAEARDEDEAAILVKRALYNCKADVVDIRRLYEMKIIPKTLPVDKKWIDAENK